MWGAIQRQKAQAGKGNSPSGAEKGRNKHRGVMECGEFSPLSAGDLSPSESDGFTL
jgi:hypothetical protein